jgi:23S rRNA (cytidine1920-2'-O)/16S rRNA (cytidine1409-2'-O)-methyltransferase
VGGGKKRRRLAELLVERGLAASVGEATALVMAGRVVVGDQRVDKAGALVDVAAEVRLKGDARFVSRAGEKLARACADLGLAAQVAGATVLDVGASTGGFTECCLELGAREVLALDVGTNQLAWSLRTDARVRVFEQTDLRAFARPDGVTIDLVVADVSFNSLARLAPAFLAAAGAPRLGFVLLVKPQFELARGEIPAGGVVADDAERARAVDHVAAAFAALGWRERARVD